MKTRRAPGGRMGLVARWAAAVAIVAAGALLGGARDALADAGDTSYWKNNTSYTNWNADAWYNTTRSWDNHNPNYCGHQRLFFDNDNQLKTYNNFSGDGLAFWQLIYTNGVTKTHTAYGSASTAAIFYDWSGTNPKIENYVSVEQRVLFLCQIGAGKTLEVNPVGGDLSLSKIYAAGQIMNVYGDHKLTINDWYAGTNSANAPSTIYVANAAHVVVTNWRAGTSSSHPLQTVNVVNSGGQVDIQQVSGLSHWVKQGSGKMVYGGNAGTSGDAAYITAEAGTLIVSNFTAVASEVTATNMTLTNSATLVMKSPATFRRVSIAQNSVVEMDVLSNSEAAHLGVVPSSENSQHQFNCLDGSHTLKLKYTTGFDPTDDAEWIVYVGRRKSSSGGSMSSTETGRITVDTSDLVSHGATGTFSSPTLCPNSNGAANTAIKITYTKPATAPELSNPTATVTGTTTATLGATVDRNNGLSITDYGIVYSKTATEPTVGGSGCTKAQKGTTTPTSGAAWTLNVTGLEAGTTYYYRGYATSSAGTGYSTVGTFTTLANQSTAVSVMVLTHTYNGNSITLVGTGGNGTGTAVYTFGTTLKTGTTGTGSLTSAGVLTVTAAGDFVFDVTRAASTGYAARTDEVTVTVNKGNQSITGLSDVEKTYGDGTFSFSAASSAGLTVSYSISPSSVATVSGSTVTIAGAGSATITASQAGNGLWNAADNVTATLTVNKAAQTLSFSPSSVTLDGDHSSVTVTATAGHGSPTITYTSSSTAIAGAGSSSGEVTRGSTGYGNVTITATAAETANYGSKTATCTVKVMGVRPSTSGSITSVTGVGVNQFTVAYSRGTGATHNVLLAKAGSSPTAPTDGSGPAAQTAASIAWGSAEEYPASSGTKALVHRAIASANIAVSGATPATHYYLALYGRTPNSATSANLKFSSYATTPATSDFWTLATEPSGQASGLTAGTVGSRKASMTWTAGGWAAASGETASLKTLLIVVPSGSSVTAPTDGVAYSAGDTIGAGTVAFAGAGTSAEVTGLTPQQTYTVYAYAYAEGGDSTTANYLTTSPASRSITTIASQGPNVWATGVDATSYLLNWSQLSSDSAGYDVAAESGANLALLDETFTAAKGWSTAASSTSVKTNASGKWTLTTCAIDIGMGVANPTYSSTDSALEFPPLTGTVTSVEAQLGATANYTTQTKGLVLQQYSGGSWSTVATWTSSEFSSASVKKWFTYTPSTPIAANGLRLRLKRRDSNYTVYIYHIRVNGSGATGRKGYSMQLDGLTSGTSSTVKVRKSPDGDWSDELTVKAGVVPNTPSASPTRNSVTFIWTDAQSGAVGYMVDATTTDGAGTRTFTCSDSAGLGTNQWSNGSSTLQWKYTGTVSTPATSSTALPTGPGYSKDQSSYPGHYLAGVAGQAIESQTFELQGATAATLAFQHTGWNAAKASTGIDASRLDVYYKLDDRPWSFVTSVVATNTGDNSWTSQSIALPSGALDGEALSVKLVAPNAEYTTSIRGAGIKGLSLTLTGAAGKYGASPRYSLTGYPRLATSAEVSAKSVTISGLTAGQSVGFRVQALQGSAANPTAKSVWVEATGTASAYTAPNVTALSGVTRNGMTATWSAGDTYQLDHYVVEWSTSSTFASLAGSANVAAGTLTKAITGLTANTKYYVRVKAVGTDSQSSAYGTSMNATTAAYTAPGTPSGSSITRNSMRVSWTAGNTTDLSKYVLQVSTSSSFPGGSTTSYNVTGGATYKDLTGLTASTTYYFRVKAVGTDSQESAWSGTGNATTSGFSGPATVTASGETRNGMTLTWDAVAGAASYNVQWTTCGLDSDTPVQEGDTCPSSTRAYDTHSATDWTYRKGYSSSAGYAAGAYPYWHSTYGHWLAGQYVNTTYKPGVETPALDLSDAASGYIEFAHRKANDGTNTLAKFSPVTLYYSLDGGAGWTNVSSCTEGTGSWVTKTIALPSVVLGRKNVRLQLRADKAAAYYDTSVSAYKPAGAGIKDIKVYKVQTGGDYTCAATQSRNVASGTTTALTGLSAETLYYFRVQAVGSGDGAGSTWTAGSSSTTPFAGPTGLAITDTQRYRLTAGWDAYTESGYTTQYEVQLTPCANAGAEAAAVGTCPAQNLAFGTSATDWTYQREYSGSTASSYPKYENGVHKLWGQYTYTSTEPGILSPELDLAGYVSANVEFSHMYVNRANMSEVALYYSLDEGANWTLVQETGTAAGATAATASSRSIPLPPEALAGGVKLLLRTKHATNYDADDNPDTTTYMVQGASIANLKVMARGVGGGDYECGTATAVLGPQSSTSKTFNGLSAGSDYYIRVRTVLTPAGGGAAEYSSWTEIPAATAVPQPPPEEVWAEGVRQNHMTVAWSEAPGATVDTRYKYEVSSCAGTTSTEVAAQETRTDGDLEEGVDDWTYVGGGTAPEATQQSTYGFEMETYPAWARLSENTIVLAGAGSPGIESIEFSTVGASAGTVTFLHGRWYDASDLSFAAVTLSYSIDGGDSWTDGPVQTATDISTAYATYSRSLSLPSGALGHAHVKVRLEARAAADSGAGTTKPIGAAIQKAKVTLTKQVGDYTTGGCVIASGTGLSADTLSAELSGLTADRTYYFRVAASDGVGAAQYGAWVESMAKTKAVPAAPASAWVVPESIGRHAMTVQWDAVAEAETYVVNVYSNDNGTLRLEQTLETAGTTLTVSGLAPQQRYDFKIQSKADGESSSGTADTYASTSDSLKVTGFCVTNILDTSLSVKWDNVANTSYTLEVGPMTTNGSTGALYETIECPATTLARSDKGNGWFYLGGNANYPKYYVKSMGTAAQKAEDQGHVLSYSSAGTPGIQSRWFSTFGAKSATIEFLHGRWFNGGANSALQVYYSIDGGTTWTLAGDIAATANEVPGSAAAGGAKTVTRFALPDRALGQRTVAIRLLAPNAASGGSYGYGAEIKDLTIKIEAYPEAASTFSDSVSGGIQNLTGLAAGQRYWFRLTATETGAPDSATAIQTAATRKKTTGVVQSQGFEGPSGNGALDTTAWGYAIKYFTVGQSSTKTWADGDPVVEVVDGENPMYGDRALRMSGSASAGVYGVVEFANKDFGAGHSENVAVTIPFAACDLAEGENLWVAYSTDGASSWQSPAGLTTITKGWTMGKIGRGGSDAPNQNWPYNRGSNTTTRPAGDAYTFEVSGVRQIAVRVAFCGNSGSAKHYYYLDEVKLERQATKPYDARATANTSGSVDLKWTPADGQSVVIIRGQDKREAPASVDLDSLPQGYEAVKDGTNFFWVNTASGVAALSKTNLDTAVTGGWKYYYYFYGALANGDGTYTLSKDCLQREVIVRGMVKAIASQGWDGWDEHPWGYRKGRVTNPGSDSDVGYWSRYQSTDPDYWYAHFVEGSFEYDGDPRAEPSGTPTYKSLYAADGTPWENDTEATNQLGVSSMTNFFGTNSFRFAGGSGYYWSGEHIYTNWSNGKANVRTNSNTYINTNNPSIQFDTVDLSGYKNVQFSMHYAGALQAGGNYLHLAISTNWNGKNGTWWAYDNLNDAGWHWGEPPQTNSYRTVTNNGVVYRESRDYALQVQEMSSKQTGARVDFYDKTLAKFGNPLVLNVPDSVTQLTARITFFDSNGRASGYWRNASVFIDEVRLTGEVAIEKPKPYISEIGKNQFMVHWAPVADATTYDVEVTEYCDESKIKLSQAFVVDTCPDGWEKSASGVTFTKTASRLYSGVSGTAHDHGLNLSGSSGALTSPEVGGTTNLQFYAKALRTGTSTHLIVEAKGDKDTAWEQIGDWTATQLATGADETGWRGFTNSLPNRQWTQVRFRRTGGSAASDSIYVDDIEFHGMGVYTNTVAFSASGFSETNKLATGLTSGKRYLAHVRAVGSPAGVEVRSEWGETADWTAGDFAVAADGFEMTRSTWANPGSGILVMAVNDGNAYSTVPAPTGDPAVGTAFGEGVVVAKSTSAQSGAGFEHVVPYGTRADLRTQRYVVYWKHGSYWEGRLETNVVLGIYRSAADAVAVTNGTEAADIQSDSAVQGRGWDGGWRLWDDASTHTDYVSVGRESSSPYGLIGSDKLYGAGGNMIRFNMSNDTRTVRLYRPLATPIESGDAWIMVTVRSEFGGGNEENTGSKVFGVQLLSDKTTQSSSIFASYGKLWTDNDTHQWEYSKTLQIDTAVHPTTKMPYGATGGKQTFGTYWLNDTGHDGSGAWTLVAKYSFSEHKLYVMAVGVPGLGTVDAGGALAPDAISPDLTEPKGWDCSAEVTASKVAGIVLMGYGYNGALDFDEVRVAPTWGELVGREPVAPFPINSASATMDGKEMIRLSWTKRAGGEDTTVDPHVTRPAVDRVTVLEKNRNTEFTAEQLAWKTHEQGESSTIGDAVVTVVYSGSGTEIEHVVLPGTSHRYAFISYAEGVYAATAYEVSTDSATSAPLTMDRYGETEYVNPFSYTNSFEVSGSGTHTEWRGGNGFTNAGGSTVHFWATGDGQNGTTANAATWLPVKPASAPAKMGTEIPNYKASAGNVMKVSPSANTSASLGRTLAQDWGGEAGKTFYIAYRMAYTYDGVNKWVGLKLIDNSGSHRGVFVGKPGTSDSSKQNMLSIDPGGGLGIGFGNYSLNAGAGNAYVVVAKVQWTAADKVNVYAMAKYADGETEFPEEEPTTGWNAQWLNMTFAGVHMIELLAGGTGSGVTPGDTYFDEIRFGGSWDDLQGPKVPTDVWMAGLGVAPNPAANVYLGDYVTDFVTSLPAGPGQSAHHLLSASQNPAAAEWTGNAVGAAFVRHIEGSTTNTEWVATNQFTTAAGVYSAEATQYAHGSATGDGTTVYSKDHGDAQYRWNAYTVKPLPAPTLHVTNGASFKVPMGWDRGTDSSRTFEEVMVVKYANAASKNLAESSLHPEQGKTYVVGDVIAYDETRSMTVIYRGTAQYYTNRPCSAQTWFAAYTVNNGHYSPRSTQVDATPGTSGGEIDVDGDPTDWVGTPSEAWNSAAYSLGELIWTDKLGDERRDKTECTSADITEFRVKADTTNVYFLVQLNGGTATMPTNTHVAVGVDARLSTASETMNWLADEANTFTGPTYYSNSAAIHFPDVQMAVHWVGGSENEWKVELFDNRNASWHAPEWWKASSALNDDGTPKTTATPCVEWAVPRSALGLDGVAAGTAVTGRFTVATFLNSGSWNNEASGVVRIDSNSCAAVDALAIAPYGSNDKDYALSAWDEGLKDKNVDFWMDARFGRTALEADTAPSTPANPVPMNDGNGPGNPTLQWENSTDAEGFVTGWLLEVADTPNFGGTGGHTENGSVLYRVNIELTPAMAELLAANPSRKITYKPTTNSKEFWWRVRARDNAGQLSAGTIQHYTVTGKRDNDGPLATLKYVGARVGDFLSNSAYRAEVEKNGEAYSIMDSEFGGSSAEFGFVIEWWDDSGVYATNHMRAWVDEYDGTDDCEDGHSKWPAGKNVGDYTWNILATNSDGTVFGRVSPNWDLMMVNTNRAKSNPPSPLNITVHTSGGEKTLTWEHHGATGEPELLIPDAMGEYQPAEGWVIQWGYDDPFQGVGDETGENAFNGQTLRAYDGEGHEISCNGVEYLTNFVSGVFGLPEYDPEVDLYLTLSAEDCCTEGAYGDEPWYPWPSSTVRNDQGSYRGLSCNEDNVLTGGWCADGPNPARNVRVNQLIPIPVKDNDVVPPIASTNRWGSASASDDRQYMPSMVIATQEVASVSSVGQTTWANLSGKLVPRKEGFQRDILYQLTDAMIPAAQNLSFLFNVYDDYLESGTQYGTTGTGERTRTATSTRSLTNSALVIKSWNPEANDGAGAWVSSAENTADFVSGKSSVFQMSQSGSTWTQVAGTAGNGPDTVLTWDLGTATEASLGNLFGMSGILNYIGTHSDGVTNLVTLHAWDNDDNRPGDQADAEITFARMLFSDDDATPPEITGSVVGTGTNYTHFGQIVSWNWSYTDKPEKVTNLVTTALNGMTAKTDVKGFAATSLADNGGDSETDFSWNADGSVMDFAQNMGGATYRSDKSKYVRFSVQGTKGSAWAADMVHFHSRVTYAGPTRFVLTMQSTNGTVSTFTALAGGTAIATGWTMADGKDGSSAYNTAVGGQRPVLRMYGAASPQPTLTSPEIPLSMKESGIVHFRYGYVKAAQENRVLKLAYKKSGDSGFTAWKTYPGVGLETTAGQGCWVDVVETMPFEAGDTGTIQFQWTVENATSESGFDLAAVYAVTSAGRDSEVPLASMTVEKDPGENGNYTNTVSEVYMGFGGARVGDASGAEYVFRLYGFRSTTLNDGVESPSNQGHWGINNLFLHGIVDEPKNQLVTDHDIAQGAWTNSLAASDGSLTGWDTVMSGLWVTNSEGTNAPAYELYFPPTHSSGSKFSSGFYALRAMSAAKFDRFEDHCTSASTWTPASIVDTANGRLTFPENGSQSSVSADLALTAMAGMTDLTLSGSLKVHAKTAIGSGGINGMDVVLQLLDSSKNVLYTAPAQSTDANRQWKTFPLAPVDVAGTDLAAVPAYARITIRQTLATGTEVYADDVLLTVSQWGAPIDNTTENAAAWTTAATNGLPSAKFTVGTASNDLSATTIPLSEEIKASGDKAYKIVGTVHDFDKDRTDDSLHVSVTNTFLLYDDDTIEPQGGSMFGGPMGIFLGDTVLSTKARSGSGGEQKWTISDHTLVSMDPSDKINFHMSFYDFSGWETRSLAMANAAKGFASQMHRNGAAVAPYVQTASEGAAGNPSATNSWQATAKNLYDLATDDDLDAFADPEGVELAMTAIVHDMDHDRADDTMGVTQQVGIVWFTDQDIDTPGYGGQTTPYYGVMLSTNVPDGGYAAMVNTNEESPNPYVVGGSLAAHQNKPTGADTLATTRAFTLYDGCLTNFDGGKVLVVTANLNDPNTHSGYGRTSTGLRRATSAADPDHPTWAEQVPKWGSEATITVTNSYIAFETTTAGGGGSMVFSNAISDDAFNSSIGQTRMSMQAGHTSWTWDSFSTNLLGTILGPAYGVSGNEFRPLYLNVYAYDNDTDRDDDQLSAQLAGPKVYFRDDDTVAPTATSAEQLFKGGAELAGNPGAATKREQVPWVNNLSGLSVRFTAATDPDGRSGGAAQHEDENGYYDVEQAGIGHYEWALPGSDTPVEGLGSRLTLGADVGGKKSASLSIDMDQGYGDYRLFAVDNDHDRAGDALAGPARPVALGYDITPPPAIGTASGKAFRLDADPESADDPTTQFDLTWPTKVGDGTVNLGPDDTSSDEYGTIPEAFRNGPDSLSPWYSYKIYYTNFEESAIASDDNPNNPEKSWVYNTFIKKAAGSSQPAYKFWQSVVTTNASTDPSAGATPYASLATVSNNAANNQKIRLYDLDFDQHYVVIIVGVDKAGNEGPAGMWSWATNNTIKFAITQGVIKASADINAMLPAAGTNLTYVGMKRLDPAVDKRAAVLYWKAAGMREVVTTNGTVVTTNLEGKVTKQYDLIYRDAPSFDELGNETWHMAGTDSSTNSGTSRTNWNYQVDAGLDTPNRLRFYRASYTGRWQDTNSTTGERQLPLASEEVYSMNNIVLSEGDNYVSLQGVPWTNTFRGVFGTDTDMWPSGDKLNTEATKVHFFSPGTTAKVSQVFFFNNGKWCNEAGADVTDDVQSNWFFTRPFSIVLPQAQRDESGEVTSGWWYDHTDYTNAHASASKSVQAMMWHPIMQVPTNAPAGAFSNTVTRGKGTYNTLSLNLPVSVHPRQLGLVAMATSNTVSTNAAEIKMQPGNAWDADQLYVIDSATKEVRGNATMFCDMNGDWHYARMVGTGTNAYYPVVGGTPIHPNDILVLISGEKPSGVSNTWTWTYNPTNFYKPPTRHMGRSQ